MPFWASQPSGLITGSQTQQPVRTKRVDLKSTLEGVARTADLPSSHTDPLLCNEISTIHNYDQGKGAAQLAAWTERLSNNLHTKEHGNPPKRSTWVGSPWVQAVLAWLMLLTWTPGAWALGPRETTKAISSPGLLNMAGLSLLTWNVAGLLYTNRVQIMETLCKWGRPHIVMLQEVLAAHSYNMKETVHAFFNHYGYQLHMVEHPHKEICRVGLLIRTMIHNPSMILKHSSRMISTILNFRRRAFLYNVLLWCTQRVT